MDPRTARFRQISIISIVAYGLAFRNSPQSSCHARDTVPFGCSVRSTAISEYPRRRNLFSADPAYYGLLRYYSVPSALPGHVVRCSRDWGGGLGGWSCGEGEGRGSCLAYDDLLNGLVLRDGCRFEPYVAASWGFRSAVIEGFPNILKLIGSSVRNRHTPGAQAAA